ncbi:hypothetical protein PPSQR21_036540 [Paenibacillus polymyxa SQR-21]|nr:hypothetical protein PPSQR21_036540 [Paenibacillus polymyxa SQR-21]
MVMESYFCPEYNKPTGVEGIIRQATSEDVQVVAQLLAGFSKDALGRSVDPTSQISAPKAAIKTGNLYLWIVNSMPCPWLTLLIVLRGMAVLMLFILPLPGRKKVLPAQLYQGYVPF